MSSNSTGSRLGSPDTPSGTEAIYKIYAESFRDQAHLEEILTEAGAIVAGAQRAGRRCRPLVAR